MAVGRQLHHLATDPELRRVRAPLRLVQSSWRLLGRPRAETLVGNVDLVHSVDLLPPPTRRPLVVTVHDVLPAEHPEWYPPEIVRAHREVLEAARRADAVVATCHATAASIASVAGLVREKVAVAEPGWQRSTSTERPPPVEGPYLFAAGGITPRKGYEVLARAVRIIGAECPPILVTGGEWWRTDEVRRAVAAADVFGAIRFLGLVEDEAMAALYQHATLVCHPSLAEGFGIPCLEAMGYGRPLVASDLPSIREMTDGAAVLVPPGDAEALAESIVDVLADDEKRDRLSGAGRAVAAAYTWERMADRVVDCYRTVLGR